MTFSAQERRRLSQLSLRLQRGNLKHFRLWPNTVRHRGREAPMGLAKTGRISEYLMLTSYLRDEIVYQYKEVSPRFELVLVVQPMGEADYDTRLFDFAAAMGFIATSVTGGGAALVQARRLSKEYAPMTMDFGLLQARIDRARKLSSVPAKAPEVRSPVHTAALISEFYEGTHVVFIGAFWEPKIIRAYAQVLVAGTTFCMVESVGSFGSNWFGDIVPHTVMRGRLHERADECALACRRERANFLFIPKNEGVVDTLCRQLTNRPLLT